MIFVISFAVLLVWAFFLPTQAAGVLQRINTIIYPFVLGGAIAFIINVPMAAFEKHLFTKNKKLEKLRRPIAFLLALLFCIAVLAFVFLAVIPELVRTVYMLAESVPAFVSGAADKITGWSQKIFEETPELVERINAIKIDWAGFAHKALLWLQNGAKDVVGSTINFAASLFSGFFDAFVGIVFAIYILFSKDMLMRQTKMLLYAWCKPERAAKIVEIASLSRKAFAGFITGQCLEACVIGVMFAIAMWIFRFPHAILISVLIGFTALIPIFGAFIGCFVGVLLIFVQNPMRAFWFLVMFLIIQQLEGNLIYPKVVGKSVGLPSLWVLVACTIGGSAFGLQGMIVMIPICSVLYTLLREVVYKRLNARSLKADKL